jgi:PHD/YefM family antitoxin component YafN of YafNO toxin-antitoxin module
MKIKSSTVLRNNYTSISSLAHQTGEPIFITKNGEGDLVVMSVEAFEDREKILMHREAVLEAEFSRLSGEKTYTTDDIRSRLKEIYLARK